MMATIQKPSAHRFDDSRVSPPGFPESPAKPPRSPGDHLYSVRHSGKKVGQMSALFSKSPSVPRLLGEPQSPKAKGDVGEIDTKHLSRVRDLADGMFSKSHSLPKMFDSPHSYRAKVDVGEIDTEHIKNVRELADKINLSPEKTAGGVKKDQTSFKPSEEEEVGEKD